MVPFFQGSSQPVPLAVASQLNDEQYRPLPGGPVRIVFGGKDWQAADAGVRVVTDRDGRAHFATQAVIRRRWSSVSIGFTPFSMPFRADHIAIGLELPYMIPRREGGEAAYLVAGRAQASVSRPVARMARANTLQ
jgi:hypothetical protein